jgi:TonB-dependent SusC/RagA subfamily outer membrane receptor
MMLLHHRPSSIRDEVTNPLVFALSKTKTVKSMNKPKPVQYRSVVFFMRVTIVQILITGATLMLGHAYDTSGQEVLDRRVTLEIEKQEIKEVLSRIESQLDVISLTTQDLRLEELLTGLFEGNIDISVIGKQIILKPINKPALVAVRTPAANVAVERRVSGRVVDAENQPIPGVNILVKGTTIGTTSDADGNYALDVPDDSDILVFSFIGFVAQEVSISNRTTVDVTLAADIQQLSEVVVVGYGEQKKATVTGSVTSVKSDVITQAPVNNLSNALVGRLPGVIFVNRSGEPGYDGSQIRIRGTNTSGNPSALIVIDGIANRSGGLERLNPADIESITVLKDASAAIYGAQAANGVILVTTKRGKTGKPEVSLNYNIGFNTHRPVCQR